VRAMRMFCLLLFLTSLFWLVTSQQVAAQQLARAQRTSFGSTVRDFARGVPVVFERESVAAPAANGGGIRETIDDKYRTRYQQWKTEFLSTDIGRAQWEMYAHHPRLMLTITVAPSNPEGATTGKYKWDEAGELVAATITLGSQVDQGYPSSVYYPVMNALEPFESKQLIGGSVLAATKIAHEFGHVMKIASTPEALYHLQVQLVPVYNKIFLNNGYNVHDPQLVELAQKMGGNPVEIWEDREYWGEANAMLFLRDRVAREKFHCRLFGKIKQAVEEYAKDYEERFAEIAKAQGALYPCHWR
jgi:YD repeat-containing protein